MDVNKLKGRAQEFLKQHEDKIEGGVGKAQQFAKSKTPKHGDKIDKVAGKLRGLIPDDGKPGDTPGQAPGQTPGQTPGSTPGDTPA